MPALTLLRVWATKWQAHNGHTPAQAAWWADFLARYEPSGRAVPAAGTGNLLGCDWDIRCSDEDEARWLAGLLIDKAGFRDSMLTTRRHP